MTYLQGVCHPAHGDESDLYDLRILAQVLTAKVYEISSFQRKILHISAVFVNNFTNHVIKIGKDICKENEIPSEILNPLIMETFGKLQKTNPFDAQTGPARRGDIQTLKSHLSLLNENQKKIYEIITNSILETYGKEKL